MKKRLLLLILLVTFMLLSAYAKSNTTNAQTSETAQNRLPQTIPDYNPIIAAANNYTNVTVTEAQTMIDSDRSLVVLDVRTQGEYVSGHIRNAKLIPVDGLTTRLNELNISNHILVYCRLGIRSTRASQILADNNFLYVYNMLGGITAWISAGFPVYIQYSSFQQAINNAQEGDTIYVSTGMYLENTVVNKTLTLVGENKETTIIDGNETGTVVRITSNNTAITDFTIQHSGENGWGIMIENCSLASVSENMVTNNYYGIAVCNSTENSMIENTVMQNFYGICLEYSTNNTVIENSLATNNVGVQINSSINNTFIHNNFIGNSQHVIFCGTAYPANFWNDSIEGNYWSNIDSFDMNHDGIGVPPYMVTPETTPSELAQFDYYPLMGIFHSFNTPDGTKLTLISNSTIENLEYMKSNATIRISVSNMTANQTVGFCRISIPHSLMGVNDLAIIIDEGQTAVLYPNYTLYDNSTHRWIYFAYQHSKHEITIVPEFSLVATLIVVMLATSSTVVIYKEKKV
jgi:parallel beta-helix repeat protein